MTAHFPALVHPISLINNEIISAPAYEVLTFLLKSISYTQDCR